MSDGRYAFPRSLEGEMLPPPKLEETITELAEELSRRLDDSSFYESDGWKHFEEYCELSVTGERERIIHRADSFEAVQYARGRISVLEYLSKFGQHNANRIEEIKERLTDLERVQEEVK